MRVGLWAVAVTVAVLGGERLRVVGSYQQA